MPSNVFEAMQQFRDGQDQQVTDVRVAVQDNITKQETTDDTMVTPETVGAAVGNQTDTIIANVAAITALQQVQLGNNNSGVSALEAFEYLNLTDLDPGLWSVSALEGALANAKIAVADAHNAGMELVTGGAVNPTVTQLARYIGPNRLTLTDFQRNGIVVAAEMQAPGFFDGRAPSTDVYARISDDETKWVRYRWFTNGIVRFEYKNGGAITQLGADLNTYARPPVGSQLFIEAGVGSSPRVFRLAYNNQFYLPINDTGLVTGLGSGCRGTGFGQRIDGGLMPGKTTQFSMADNKAADTRGVGFRAYRSSTGGIAVASGDTQCPTGTFDVVDRITNDMTWDGKSLTIGIEGWYMFPMKLRYSTTQQANVRWINSIYRTTGSPAATSIAAYGDGSTNINVGSNGGQTPQNVEMGGGGIPLYCLAGDIITPGNFTTTANNIIGDAGGLQTWFCAILLNRSLA